MGVYTLLLRCAEATVLNTDHMWPHYTQNNVRETGETYSLVKNTAGLKLRSAMSFARVEGLKLGCTIICAATRV